MADLSFFVGAAAAVGLGVVHGLTPCAHSWPVLVPIVGRTGSVFRPAAFYGAGIVVAGTALGVVMGGGGHALKHFFDSHLGKHVEEAFGVVMILAGAAIAFRTRLAHAGHVHGECAPPDASGAEGSCGHAEHHPKRFLRYGRDLGLFILGLASVTVPCTSNFTAAGISVAGGDVVGGAAAYGLYALAAAVTTYVILRMVRRGTGVLSRLASPKFEARILFWSGLGLVVWGVLTVLHIGHDHHHHHHGG
jgi:nickel/cobalt exporter